MKHTLKLLSFATAAILVVGCQTSRGRLEQQMILNDITQSQNAKFEKEGSPYRRVTESVGFMGTGGAFSVVKLMGSPAPTVADATLKADVLKKIGSLENAKNRNSEPTLLKTNVLLSNSSEVVEAWEIDGKDRLRAYKVSFKPVASGGTDYAISGPFDGPTR